MSIFEKILNFKILIGMVIMLCGITLPATMFNIRSKGKTNGITVWLYSLTTSIFGFALLIYGLLS